MVLSETTAQETPISVTAQAQNNDLRVDTILSDNKSEEITPTEDGNLVTITGEDSVFYQVPDQDENGQLMVTGPEIKNSSVCTWLLIKLGKMD